MTEEEIFTRKFFDKLSKKVSEISVKEIKELKITTLKNGEERHHFLDNAYANYKMDSANLEEILENFVNASASIYVEREPFDISKIVPIVKDKRYHKSLSEIRNGGVIEEVYEKYNEELYIFYVLNLEHSLNYFSKDELQQEGYTVEDLREVSIDNLYNAIEPIMRNGEDGFYMIICGGNFESSLILDQNVWTKENFPVDGEIMVGIPSRDIVFVTGSENEENLAKLKEAIKEVDSNEGHLVSNKMFVQKNNKFVIYHEVEHDR